jgi:hypothetical protein
MSKKMQKIIVIILSALLVISTVLPALSMLVGG